MKMAMEVIWEKAIERSRTEGICHHQVGFHEVKLRGIRLISSYLNETYKNDTLLEK